MKNKIIAVLLFSAMGLTTYAQQVDSDIYFLEYNLNKEGKYFFAAPFNFTKRKGYDNQPSFSASGEHVYFVAYKDTIQSDIYDYSIYDSTTIAVTNTPESEFSPMLAPDGQHISVIRIDADKAQRMYNVTLDGNDAEPVIYTTDSAAYYDWIDEKNVALVILEKSLALNIYETPGNQFTQLAKNVGRCVKKIPNTHEIYHSFFTFEKGPPNTNFELNGWGDDLVHEYLKAITIDGRIAVLYSNKDYGCEWDYDFRNKRFLSEDNTKFGVNIIVYALQA